MRCLITGASGFVGTALCTHLGEHTDSVVALSRSTGGPDITDRDAVFAAFASAAPDVVFHLAAQAHVPTSWTDPITTLRVNVEGTQNVLDAAAAVGGARVLVASSAEVYGSVPLDELPITEASPLCPANPYAASKVAADALGEAAYRGRGQDVLRIRAFNHIGPGQAAEFVAAGLAARIARAERDETNTVNVGALDVRRDFTDVRDVVRAYRQLAISGIAGASYNVCSGVDRPIRQIADGLAALSTTEIRFVTSDDLIRPSDTPVVRGDNTRLRRDTGWQPEIPFDSTLRDVLDDARSRIAR